ncbi:DUF3304 domain-containing protein [Crenobacter sp. SG2303]|uniref:DUF3304 domain-containing protein n=1 Tax=Crenobacter oryzisoli TaxID=3056844 RepID=A0ABT7XL49_9NEIS|nr:DUF3304 domain-containing protein [Crenobacter sp. SG2303]MDN0074501.1 DUF3304 domain-containing protein [Crenobacter sp. SG2303]
MKRSFLILLLSLLMLSACAVVGQSNIGVSLTAVNYTDEDYDVVGIARADDPTQLQAMDRVAAYSASGIMCCVSLPDVWKPGLKVVVLTRAGTKAKTLEEWDKEKIPLIPHELEVPRYTEPATLWVQILDGGKLAVAVSRYDPSNANWPGVVKGWPKPSLSFKKKIWQRDYNILVGDLHSLEKGIKMILAKK